MKSNRIFRKLLGINTSISLRNNIRKRTKVNMRTFIVLVALFALGQGSLQTEERFREILKQPRIFEKEILKAVACVQDILVNGDEDIGIPAVDPLHINDISVDLGVLPLPGVSGNLALSNLKVNGVAKWEITNLKISALWSTVDLALEWKSQDLEGQYKGDITVGDDNLAGEGRVEGVSDNVKVTIKVKYNLLGRISLKSVSIKPSVGNGQFEITGLSHNGVDISKDVSAFISGIDEWVNANADRIDKVLGDAIVKIVNDLLSGGKMPGKFGVIGDIIGKVVSKCLSK